MTNATDRAVETIARALTLTFARDHEVGLSPAQQQAYADNYAHEWTDDAEAIRAALDSAGLVIAPKEPTEAMVEAGDMEHGSVAVWGAMISAKDRG